MSELQKVVLQFLTACEAVGLAGQKVDLDNAETIRLFAAVCEAAGLMPVDLRQAMTPFLASGKFFPKPAELVEFAAPYRAERIEREYAEKWRDAVEMIDEQGRLWLVPHDRVEIAELPGPRGGLRKVHSDTPISGPRALSAGGADYMRSLGYEPRDGREPHHAE